MRAITYSRFGAPDDVLADRVIDTPSPRAGEVLVRLHASGVNPSDVKLRAGLRAGEGEFPYPLIVPHSDGAGVVEAVGDGVAKSRVGERVWIWNGQWRRPLGTAAEYIALPQQQAVPLPERVDFATGAVLGIPGLTACHAVLGGGPVEGKTLLVSGGAGTVGRLAVQAAAASGARVLATASGEHGFAAARAAGAAAVFDYRGEALADEILESTGGAPVQRIVEGEFGSNAATDARVIAENGTIVSYGSALEMTPRLPFYPLMFKAVTLELMLVYLLTPAQRQTAIDNLTRLLTDDALDIRIDRSYDLADCADAHRRVESGQRAGAVILTI